MDLHMEDPMAQADPGRLRADARPVDHTARNSVELQGQPLSKRARTEPTEHNCDICRTSYSKRKTLLRHQKTPAHCERAGLPKPSYPCQYCGDELARDDLRYRHEREVHLNISRSTGPVRVFNVTVAEPNDREGNALSQSVQPIRVQTSTHSASTTSPNGDSTPSIATQSTPPTDLELEPSQVVREYDMDDAGVEFLELLNQAFSSLGHTQLPSGPNMLHLSTVVEDDPARVDDQHFEPSAPELIPDTGSIRSISTVGSIKSRFMSSANLLRSTLIYKGATPRARGYKLPVLCVLCNEYLGSNLKEVRVHLDKHSKLFHETFSCETCQVSFTHEQDLIFHEKSAAKGHCGFEFEHGQACQGHHPPDIFGDMLTDNDRFQYTLRLQHWEQAQLKAYLDQVNDLMHTHRMSRNGDCWSVDVLLNSLESLSSTLGYRKPRSALEPGEQLSRLDNSRLTGSLAKFDSRRKARNMPLAALSGDRAEVRAMILEGLDVNATCQLPATHKAFPSALFAPLDAAIEGGDAPTVQLLIEQGANVNQLTYNSSLPLFRCVRRQRADLAELLLKHGAHVNAEASWMTACKIAVQERSREIVTLLLKYGANVNAQMKSRSALKIAVSRRDQDMVELLLYNGADVYTEPERSHLIDDATASGHSALAMLLQKYAAGVGALEWPAWRMIAVLHGNVEALRSVAFWGPGVDRGNPEIGELGRLLQFAACHGRNEMVELILDRGAHVDSESGALGRPLAWAISQGHKDTVELLLHRGAKTRDWTGSFSSALQCATLYGRKEIALLLLDQEVDVGALDDRSYAHFRKMMRPARKSLLGNARIPSVDNLYHRMRN